MNQYEKGFEDCKKQVKAAVVLAIEEAILMEREACAKLCEEREEYSMQIPCPDGIVGCGVFHSVRGSKLKDGRECAAAIRARWQK
jgi:hypothetical protein